MQKIKRSIAALLAVLILVISVTIVLPAPTASATSGVQSKLDQIRAVYPNTSYFTASGGPCYDAGGSDCSLANIPSRGGLPSGASVASAIGNGWSCNGFARYVFYYVFGQAFYNASVVSSPSLGDFIYMNGTTHAAIYLWEDSNYYYVFNANGDYECGVEYNQAFRKSSWSISTIYHATNYNQVNGTPSYSYTNISAGSYFIRNVMTDKYLAVKLGVDQNAQNVFAVSFENSSACRMDISATTTGYKIKPQCCSSRIINPYGSTVTSGLNVNIYNDENDSSQWWRFRKVDGGYVIHNVQNENCVLDVDEYDNVSVATYKPGNTSQIWQLGSVNDVPAKPKYTCSVNGNSLTISISSYKSSEYYDVYIRNAVNNSIVYKKINIGGASHTVTLNEGSYKVEVWGVNKAAGMYTQGDTTNVKVENVVAEVHDGGKWKTVKEATTTSTGLKELRCTKCNALLDTKIIEKLSAEEKEPTVNFTDVKKSDFFYTPVQWAVENGVTTGTSKTTFGPNESCTRAQAVTFLWRAAGSPAPKSTKNPFTDVKKNDYYYKAVLWAAEKGVTAGTTKTTFSPNDVCTRGQIVTFLWRAQSGKKVSASNPFKDVRSNDFYYDAVLWAVKNGVTTGTSATAFGPGENCTRGQIVTFLYRAIAK